MRKKRKKIRIKKVVIKIKRKKMVKERK